MLPFFICFQRDLADPNLFFEDEAIEVESLEDPDPELVKDDLEVNFLSVLQNIFSLLAYFKGLKASALELVKNR